MTLAASYPGGCCDFLAHYLHISHVPKSQVTCVPAALVLPSLSVWQTSKPAHVPFADISWQAFAVDDSRSTEG